MIHRLPNKKRWFSIAPGPIEDEKLSWQARGLLVYLLSRPDDWEVEIQQLVSASPDGKTVVQSCLRELAEHGYAHLVQHRDDKNHRAIGKRWEVSEYPRESLTTIKPDSQKTSRSENLTVRKPDHQETSSITYDLEETYELEETYDLEETKKREHGADAPSLGAHVMSTETPPSQSPALSKSKKTRREKQSPAEWPQEYRYFADWLEAQDVLTLIAPVKDPDFWALVSRVAPWWSDISWMEKQFAKMEEWAQRKPRKRPTVHIRRFMMNWLENAYEEDRKRAYFSEQRNRSRSQS